MVKYRIYIYKSVVEIDCKSTDFVSTENLKTFLTSRNIPLSFSIRFKDKAYRTFYDFLSEGHIVGSVSRDELGFIDEPEWDGKIIAEDDYTKESDTEESDTEESKINISALGEFS